MHRSNSQVYFLISAKPLSLDHYHLPTETPFFRFYIRSTLTFYAINLIFNFFFSFYLWFFCDFVWNSRPRVDESKHHILKSFCYLQSNKHLKTHSPLENIESLPFLKKVLVQLGSSLQTPQQANLCTLHQLTHEPLGQLLVRIKG